MMHASAVRIVSAAALAFSVLVATTGERMAAMAQRTDPAPIDKALQAVAGGDYGALLDLAPPGPGAVEAIAPYLAAENEAVRREAVGLLARIAAPGAAPALAAATADQSYDVSHRAAGALYRLGPDAVDAGVARRLVTAVAGGTTAAGALLMLSYADDAEPARAALRKVRAASGDQRTELFDDSPVVDVALVADVALTRLGDAGAETRLLDRISIGDPEELRFLVYVLREIDAWTAMQTLAEATLSSDAPVQGAVPSGTDMGLRLADVAAAGFADRYGIPFTEGAGVVTTVTSADIKAVRDRIAAAPPP